MARKRIGRGYKARTTTTTAGRVAALLKYEIRREAIAPEKTGVDSSKGCCGAGGGRCSTPADSGAYASVCSTGKGQCSHLCFRLCLSVYVCV